MNVLLLGKTGGIIGWTEDIAAGLKIAGHAIRRRPTITASLQMARRPVIVMVDEGPPSRPCGAWIKKDVDGGGPSPSMTGSGSLDPTRAVIFGRGLAIVATRNPWLGRSLEQALLSPATGAPLTVSITRKPARVISVGLAGQRRVLAHRTYAHRVDAIAALAGAKTMPDR